VVRVIRIAEERSGLSVALHLLAEAAPVNVGFLWRLLVEPRAIPAVHAMSTGPEISAPIPAEMVGETERTGGLPLENGTVTPHPGELVPSFVPPHMWGGGGAPIFDLGLSDARLFFPIGWHAGSVLGRVASADLHMLAEASRGIRQNGACTLSFTRAATA
jgi:hypothetical protein